MIWLAAGLLILMLFAVDRTNRLDVKTGRRDSLDYGSNLGWYWPWSLIIQVSFFGIIFCILGSL